MITYVIHMEGTKFIKIGQSSDVLLRLHNLAENSPFSMRLLFTSEEREKDVHIRFAKYHVRGEWFRLHGELLEWVIGQCDNDGKPVWLGRDYPLAEPRKSNI